MSEEKKISTLEKVSAMGESIVKIEKAMGGMQAAITSINENSMYGTEKALGVEASLASVVKLLKAIMEELVANDIVKNDNVYTRMRKDDEEADRAKIESMKKAKMLEVKESVGETSLTAIKSTLVNTKDGTIKILSDYMSLDLAIMPPTDIVKQGLVGKKIGESIELGETDDGSKILYTVQEIYELKPQNIKGETAKKDLQG